MLRVTADKYFAWLEDRMRSGLSALEAHEAVLASHGGDLEVVDGGERYSLSSRLGAAPDELPVLRERERIIASIRRSQFVLLDAATGAGKSTVLPQILREAGFRRVVVTQPRRVAARAVAERIAKEAGAELGGDVGFEHRFLRRRSDRTEISVVTDGVLVAELAGDPLLHRYDAVILDEVHERTVDTDLLLLAMQRAARARPDLRVVVASATMPGGQLAGHLGAERLSIPGRVYPVRTVLVGEIPRYAQMLRGRGSARSVMDAACAYMVEEMAEARGDVLVFLPGKAEIDEMHKRLATSGAFHGCEILALHSEVRPEEQARALRPGRIRRVILSTDIAETSLTIEGVVHVVDLGYHRRSVFNPELGTEGLMLMPITRANAVQRRGRAGRLGPGVYHAMFSAAEFDALEPAEKPELHRVAPARAVLLARTLGLDVGNLPDPLPEETLRAAERELRALGGLDDSGAVTPVGKKMARLPLEPRLGKLMLEASEKDCGAAAAEAVVFLSMGPRRLFVRFPGKKNWWEERLPCPSMLDAASRAWDTWRQAAANKQWGNLREAGFNIAAWKEAEQAVGQITGLCRRMGLDVHGRDLSRLTVAVAAANPSALGLVSYGNGPVVSLEDGRSLGELGREIVVNGAYVIVHESRELETRRGGRLLLVTAASPISPQEIVAAFPDRTESRLVSWEIVEGEDRVQGVREWLVSGLNRFACPEKIHTLEGDDLRRALSLAVRRMENWSEWRDPDLATTWQGTEVHSQARAAVELTLAGGDPHAARPAVLRAWERWNLVRDLDTSFVSGEPLIHTCYAGRDLSSVLRVRDGLDDLVRRGAIRGYLVVATRGGGTARCALVASPSLPEVCGGRLTLSGRMVPGVWSGLSGWWEMVFPSSDPEGVYVLDVDRQARRVNTIPLSESALERAADRLAARAGAGTVASL